MILWSVGSLALLLAWASPSQAGLQETTVSVTNQQGILLSENSVDQFNISEAQIFSSNDDGEEEFDEEEEEGWISEASYEATSPAVLAVDERGSDLGVSQIIDADTESTVKTRILEARRYVSTVVNVDPSFTPQIRSICKNQDENCAFWATVGECEKNPAYMKVNCGPVCFSCDQLDIMKRCPLDPNVRDALYPGDLNKMFERITTSPEYQKYEPRVVSRPTLAPGDSLDTADYIVGGPWMVLFENVLNKDEAQRIRDLGGSLGYERSKDVGVEKPDGTYTAEANSGRTSTNAWCTDECYDDPIAQDIMQRIANITGIPETNQESLQLLRYEKTQFYQTHSDFISHQRNRQPGVRILTFYIYLNDVEEGGGTNFPRLNLTVTPKLGRAALWPSVLNDQPNILDSRTNHQALPVIRGVKFGANAWIHQRDYKGPNNNGC